MDDFLVRQKLRSYVEEHEPPMTLTSADLLAKGARRRLLRLGTGTSFVVAAILTLGFVYLPPNQAQPAAVSAEAACLARVPIVPGASPDITTDALASESPVSPADSATAARISCYLVDTLLTMLPDQQFLPTTWRGTAPFQTVVGEQGVTASARTAGGSFGVIINRSADAWHPATSPDTVLRPEPGLTVEIHHDNPISPSSRVTIVVARTAGTVIIVSADNLRAIRPDPVAEGAPMLTDDQVTQIATAPQLVLYG
jgi:hypothetical protein